MKWVLALLLLVLLACAPAREQPPAAPAPEAPPAAPEVVTREEVVSPPQPKPLVMPEEEEEEAPGTPLEPSGAEIDPYSQLGCEQLLTDGDFAKECGKDINDIVVTYRIGTKNCFVNIKDRVFERRTAGITLTGYKDAETAEAEFDRRLKVLKAGADKSVGERAYVPPYQMVDRTGLEFLRDEFIIEMGADVRLCSADGLLAVARIFDSRLK